MSCFLVNPEHIQALVMGIPKRQLCDDLLTFECGSFIFRYSKSDIANELYAQNIKAVNDRYNESKPLVDLPSVKITSGMLMMGGVRLLKLLDGLEYQLSDSNDYEYSKSKALITRLRKIYVATLPGYDDAEWSL